MHSVTLNMNNLNYFVCYKLVKMLKIIFRSKLVPNLAPKYLSKQGIQIKLTLSCLQNDQKDKFLWAPIMTLNLLT